MDILYLLIPISLLVVTLALLAFRWAVKSRQFEDLDSPAMIPLMDDTPEERQRLQQQRPPPPSA